jgi:hypothetical protein
MGLSTCTKPTLLILLALHEHSLFPQLHMSSATTQLTQHFPVARLPIAHTTQRVDLPNGCVCLTPTADVVATISVLLADPEPFDYILAEGACECGRR